MYIPGTEHYEQIEAAQADKRRLCPACNIYRDKPCPNCGLAPKAIRDVTMNNHIRKTAHLWGK